MKYKARSLPGAGKKGMRREGGSFRKEVNSSDVNPNQGSKKEGHGAFPWEITGLEA